MQTIETLDELQLQKGEVHAARISIGSFSDGTEIYMPLIVGKGSDSGPTLLLTALLHGIEVGGYDVIRKLMYEELDFKKVRGRVVAVPIVNPFAFGVSNRFTPQDSADLNRVFPGSPNGTISQRIAHIVVKRLVAKADFVIDYHSCNPPSEMFTIVDAGGDKQVQEKSWAMAKAFGALSVTSSAFIPGTFSGYLSSIGKPAITPELVFSRRFDPSAEAGAIGTKNVMKFLGMLEGETETLPDALPYNSKLLYTSYLANKGGFVYFRKNIGEDVAKNEIFAEVLNPWGEVIEQMNAPVDGMIIAYPMAGNQAVTTGDKVAYFASALQ
jgi:predicted deacylase